MGVALAVKVREIPAEQHILNFVSNILLWLDVATGFRGIDVESIAIIQEIHRLGS